MLESLKKKKKKTLRVSEERTKNIGEYISFFRKCVGKSNTSEHIICILEVFYSDFIIKLYKKTY